MKVQNYFFFTYKKKKKSITIADFTGMDGIFQKIMS